MRTPYTELAWDSRYELIFLFRKYAESVVPCITFSFLTSQIQQLGQNLLATASYTCKIKLAVKDFTYYYLLLLLDCDYCCQMVAVLVRYRYQNYCSVELGSIGPLTSGSGLWVYVEYMCFFEYNNGLFFFAFAQIHTH